VASRSFPPRILLYGLLLIAGLFIWRSAQLLPPQVASHFIGSGAANAWMPREGYVHFMLLMGVLLPAAVSELIGLASRLGGSLRVPNRDYWMAPERREQALSWMQAHARWFGCLVSGFICYIHWLLIEANRAQPPLLPPSRVIPAITAFTLCLVAWGLILQIRFLRRR
jgi:hypothetical protein